MKKIKNHIFHNRLAFHDCIGGCDGCININDKDNAGLGHIVKSLENIYITRNLNSMLSRYDFKLYIKRKISGIIHITR